MKTIKINGEFTKEELQEKIKEFDKHKWEIKANPGGNISFVKHNGFEGYETVLLLKIAELDSRNLSTVSRDLASAMGDLMDTKSVLDCRVMGYNILYLNDDEKGTICDEHNYPQLKHFKTEETARLAAKLLNESKDMQDGIKRMSE